ncbi:glycosyltransferase involved in cell wall biosynthesis [Homoserinimonas aerilata]|uniref:Glycosyltransferase involved in cell wall biosynthesis n=1 Tax=Homoserinimonas aerilata TaxID=1162970 RepID=A0A542YKN7_9MICO|nr:glycosyltransferase family 1 protein [Homoserinimonas aerilata]TQL48638.1 glycosyltransferase involved in cell wall biosynthesis [Homoserinimonas aerilata]
MPLVFVNLLQSTGTKGGIEVYARELYSTLASVDSEFEYVAYASSELAAKGAPWFPGKVIDSGISGENRLSWAFGELFSVAKAARRAGADLIHGPAMLGPLNPSVPVVISMHDLLYFTHPHLMQTKLFTEPVKWMERRAAAKAARLITISEVSAAAIRKHLRFPADRIDLIPLAGRTNTLGGGGGERERDLFISIGQRSPYKGFENVVRGWAEIPADRRPRLVITGSHGDDPLVPLVRELGLEDTVELKEWVSTEELTRLFDTATAIIDPTLAGGSSLPTLEAMNIGLPPVLADTPVLKEVGADAAVFYSAQDPADLARVVQELMAAPEQLAELSVRGRERAKQFSWERVARETLDSFRAALAQ